MNPPDSDSSSHQRWGYLRISLTRDQQSNSLDVQRTQLEEHCARQGLTLVGVTVDEDSSATELDFFDRPRVQTMLSTMPDGCRHLMVTKLDRLSRSRVDVGLRTIQELLDLGFRTTALDAPTDTSTASGEAMLGVMLIMSRFETRRRKERQLEAVANMHLQRHRVGSVPYGWDAVPIARISKTKRQADDLTPNWKEQSILRQILNYSAAGETDRQIARRLNASGLRTKKHGQEIGGKPVKGKWHSATVRSVRLNARFAEQPQTLAA